MNNLWLGLTGQYCMGWDWAMARLDVLTVRDSAMRLTLFASICFLVPRNEVVTWATWPFSFLESLAHFWAVRPAKVLLRGVLRSI